MIINGGSRCNAAFFSKHLINAEKNERVSLVDVRGLSAKKIGSAFREMKAVASGTRCKNFFYHANLNPREDERLTPDQWERAVDVLEKRLGLEDHARFVVEHEKEGRVHRHVVWSRIDVERMRAVRMDNDFAKHQDVARQLEKEFGLSRVESVLGEEIDNPRPERRPEPWEVFRGKNTGVDVFKMKNELTEIWRSSQNGKEFAAALEGHGYILARGDSRRFCVVDAKGDVHSLARRIEGSRAADINSRLSDIDISGLPHVAEAAALQRERGSRENMDEEQQRKTFVEEEEKQREQFVKEEEDRKQQTLQEEEQRKEIIQKEENLRLEQFKEQATRQAELAKEMEARQQQIEAYKTFMARQAEEARRQEETRRKQEEKTARVQEGAIANAHNRYGQALAQRYDVRDPYGSLARSAMAEYGTFLRERENLDRQIAKTSNPVEQQKLELRKQIEAAEYMAITSERIATQSEVIVGRRNSPEAVKQRERAVAFQKEAQELRREFRELGASKERGEGKGSVRVPEKPSVEQKQPTQEDPPLVVEDKSPGKPRGAEQKLTDYVKSLPEKPAQREFSKEELRSDPKAKEAYYTQIKDDKNRAIALEHIRSNLKSGKNLDVNDIRRLNRDDLSGIKRNGDKHLKEIVKQHEQERERGRGLER